MAKDVFGDFLSTIGSFDLSYDVSNLALIQVDSGDFPALITDYSVSRSERKQSVPCFNDAVHIYAFGRNPLIVSLAGFTIPIDKKYNLKKLIDGYDTKYRAFVGELFTITLNNGETIKGHSDDFTYRVNANTPVLVNFSMNITGLGPNDTILSSSATSQAQSGGTSSGRAPSVGRS